MGKTAKPQGKITNSNEMDGLLEEYVSKLEKKVTSEISNLRMMADAMPQIVWMAEPDGHVDYFNERWYEYTGFSKPDNSGSLREALHPGDREKVLQAWEEAVNSGETYEVEYRLKNHETGQYCWFLGRALPAHDQGGKIIRWFGTSTNIDDYKKAQAKKDDFIAIASHELKTPITSIKIFAEIIAKRLKLSKDSKSTTIFEKMDEQITKLSSLVDNLLNIARLDSGKLELNRERFTLCELIDEVVGNLELASEDHNIVFNAKSKVVVDADRQRLEQVLVNTITNGIKYSPDGCDIEVDAIEQDDEVVVSVKDSGIGIPKDQQPYVFDRYYSIDDVRKKQDSTGLGLGLYISSEIIKSEGGRIWLESEVGRGSTFYFSLPVARGDMEQDREQSEKDSRAISITHAKQK